LAFSFLIAVAAGLFRVGDLYGYRHANIGFLLQLSSLVLIYSAIPEKYRKGLFAFFMVIYAGLFMRVAIAESGEWAAWGRETLRSAQIGDAIGVHDPSWFKYVWKFGDNELSSEHSRQVFRDQRVGIYASAPYRRFTGELSLPPQAVSCEYSIKSFLPVRTDSRAFLLRGITRTVTGRTMPEVLFLDAAGTHVGYGLSEMPSHDLLDQLQLAWGWGGYMLFSEKPLPALVTVIAFDNDRHCQPWNIPLPANAQRE
ncbi:MAG TPA: hypothetical protein PLF22_13050, partial [Pseudomonadales bacterium]|nr:hypothetical protein [Pseudomonadales bacterium]